MVTFSIFNPSRTGKAEGERKGALEVVTVVSPHLSSAHVTEMRDANMSPIVVGDLIFNPAWNPSVRKHIAIAGMIDLTGSGRDDTAEFIRNLEKLGVVVDAYLDLKSLTIQGPGITRATGYLVLGPEPQFDDSIVSKSDANTRKKEVLDKMNELKSNAKQEGVQFVNIDHYLAMIGYRVPKNYGSTLHMYDTGPMKGVMRKSSGEADKSESDEKKPPVDK